MIEKIVIALVGEIASGKGIIVDHLRSKDFEVHSLSDIVREEAAKRGLEPTRSTLQNLGNVLRNTYGSDVLARRTVDKIVSSQNLVIDGVRNPHEIFHFKREINASVVGVIAPYDLRLQRYLQRASKRREDTATAESFRLADLRDHGKGENNTGQQVQACLDLSDIIINNDSTINVLIMNIDRFISIRYRHDPKTNT